MASVGHATSSRWWRLQSNRRLMVDAALRDGQLALTVNGVGSVDPQSVWAVEARYYGIDRPELGGGGQILRVATHFQLDVLTHAELRPSWAPLTRVGEIAHPPDDYGPGTTLAVWRRDGLVDAAHDGGVAHAPHGTA